jgi:hypothetical protein
LQRDGTNFAFSRTENRRHKNSDFQQLSAIRLPLSLGVNLSRPREITTEPKLSTASILNKLRTAWQLLYLSTDEVARNGALHRTTSARGFLERPLQIYPLTPPQPSPNLFDDRPSL